MDLRLIFLLLLIFFSGCNEQPDDDNKFHIVTTTGMIADAVKNITGEGVKVEALMGPGIDPHLYKATQGDLKKLQSADLIFYNGLRLEGKMGEILEKLNRIKPVYAVADQIPESKLMRVPQYNNSFDPHIWFDVKLWQNAVQKTTDVLVEHLPEQKDLINKQSQQYITTLDSLDRAVKTGLQQIPEDKRVLITAHDAFGYFGKAYDMEVKGLQGISTLSEPGIRDIKELVDYIVKNEIKAVFLETSVSEKAINAVIEGARERGFDLKLGGSLYSDAMGEAGTFEGTYIGMVHSNVGKMIEALK